MKQGTEFKHVVYQVKITGDKKEYSLKLDEDNGDVLDIKEKPIKKKAPPKEANKKQDSKIPTDKSNKKNEREDKADKKREPTDDQKESESESKKTVISAQEAEEIALREYSGEIVEIEPEDEDGRFMYEVEIERGELEAYTGEIIVIEIEED